jgi:HPt (histidine-containing phosphotransfer) domain-containing protein
MELAERLIHTLKGVSGNIGAVKVYEASEKLARIINAKGANEELQQALADVDEQLSSIISQLEPFLPVLPAAALTEADRNIAPVCDRLAKLLTDQDTEALDIFQEHAALLKATFPRHYDRLERSIQSYDFESALRVLIEARAHLLQ